MMRNMTILCKYFRLFELLYFWYSCDNCNAQFRVRRIRCDDDNLKWRQFIAFNAMTISWFVKMRTRISCWNFSDNSVNVFRNQISNYESYVFSFLLRDRSFFQKFESLFDLKQRFLDSIDKKIELKKENDSILMIFSWFRNIENFQALWFSIFLFLCFFEIQWFIQHIERMWMTVIALHAILSKLRTKVNTIWLRKCF